MAELSDNARYWLKKLGNFTITHDRKYIKGWALLDGFEEYERNYWSSQDLRNLSDAVLEVANLLDAANIQQ